MTTRNGEPTGNDEQTLDSGSVESCVYSSILRLNMYHVKYLILQSCTRQVDKFWGRLAGHGGAHRYLRLAGGDTLPEQRAGLRGLC